MAGLLYRLGRFSARRAWTVVTAWVVVLLLAGGAYLAFGGTLTSAVTIPGTATEEVTDQLREEFPAASGGSGTVVFHTDDDAAFTDEQRAAISATLQDVAEVDGVAGVVDPFATAAQLADQQAQIESGREQIAAGEQQLDAGQAQLDAGQAMIDQAQQQLDAQRAQAEAAGALAAVQDQLDAGQAQIDAQQAELDAQQQAADAGRTELETQSAQLEQGAALLDLASGLRTLSADESAAVGNISFSESQFEVSTDTKDAVVAAFEDADLAGASVELSNDLTQEIPSVLGPGEVVGVIIAAIVLLVMLGTAVAAALPIFSALVGVGIGAVASLALSGAVDMLSVTPVLGIMLGLAVGIDYSLFILNRHRRQLRDGVELEESIGLANGTAGNAVVFAGTTVFVALLALNVTGIPFLGLMGTVGAFCILIAVLIAVTLTPALLSRIGLRVLPKKLRATVGHEEPEPVPSTPMKTSRAVLTLVAGLAALLVIAIPALDMRLGLPTGASEPEESSQYQAYTITAEKFGAGINGPLLVVADLPEAVTEDEVVAEQVRIGQELAAFDDVVAVAPIGANEAGTVLAFQVVPADGPTSESTEQLVRDLRDSGAGEGVTLGVAGSTSANIDVSEKLSDALPGYLGIVVGLSLLILIIVFRSIFVPVTATLGFVLSLFAGLGGVVAIYQWGWLGSIFGVHDAGPVLSFLPIIVTGVLFGLAMDYQLFLVSGMREAFAHGVDPRVAVRRGLHAGRVVVTAAAIIMASVFAGFVFAESAIIRPLGFGLAFGVLLDAFVVRMLLIPAVMHLAGKSAWWIPKWLDKILPDVDVEGASLERSHPHPTHRTVDMAAVPGTATAGAHADAAPVDAPAGDTTHDGDATHRA
ncbi:MMPL family transporter [Cellulomonas triticagri]|uniref:RND transporter n=1 Tax=Cellulomonas triticagri TaxID=2483352 RepID=A0A3M2J7U1_9CELL|nr:MMPL family transporter [Cellulomonas triticagri]RMI08944.1 RND transporter [Cellulomonas triticagri]